MEVTHLMHTPPPQGPAVQLLLWQVLQQLQSVDPNSHQCMILMDELRTERSRIRQERSRREEFEDEAYSEITKLRNDKKLSIMHADGILLDLQVKNSRLESLEKHLADERSSRIKVEVESEKCKALVEQEREVNKLVGQELGTEKEKAAQAQEAKRALEQEIVKLESQLYEEKMAGMSAKRELEREKKHIMQLQQTLRNETLKRLAAEHAFFRQILELKNNISLLTSLQDFAENSKQICDMIQANLDNERDKVSKLKDELSDLRTDLFKLNVQLNFEQKTVANLQDNLDKELNQSMKVKEELANKIKRIRALEAETEETKTKLRQEETEKQELMKELAKLQVDLTAQNNSSTRLKEDLEAEAQKVRILEGKLTTANSSDRQMEMLTKKLDELSQDLTKERSKINSMQDKLITQGKEVKELKKNLEVEKQFSEEERQMRKMMEKDLERAKHLYVKCDSKVEYTTLQRASEVCDAGEAKSQIRKGLSAADATRGSSPWKTSVHLAVESGCIDLVQLYARNSSLLNIWDENGATPLHWAARASNLNVVRVLLDSGAAINAWDKEGKTPLDYAGGSSNGEVMKLLIDHGAALGSVREYGTTTEKIPDDVDGDDYNYYY